MYSWRVGRSSRRFRNSNRYSNSSRSRPSEVDSVASNEASRLVNHPEQRTYSSGMTSAPAYSVVRATNPMLDDDEYDFERGILNDDANAGYQDQQENTVDDGGGDQVNEDTASGNDDNRNTGTGDDDNNNPNALSEEIQILTNRLRILFFTLTLPILPLGIILSLLILQLVYAASTSPSCGVGHPLRIYTFFTIIISTYATKHKAIRNWLFNYDRTRDGMVRPRIVRIYDQCFHFLAIMYVYYGTVLVQSCQDDLVDVALYPQQLNGSMGENGAVPSATSDAMGVMNNTTLTESTCAYSCPELFDSMQRFVFMLKIFVIVLLLPLVCLPFIYIWILRRINTEEAWLRFGREVNNGGDGKIVLASEIMEELKDVVLVPLREGHGSFDNENDAFKRVRIVEKSVLGMDKDGDNDSKTESSHHDEEDPLLISNEGDESQTKDWDTVKDCCICMCEFDFYDQSVNDDSVRQKSSGDIKRKDIVQTKCGHIFHKSCIGSWIGGNWNEDQNRLESSTSRALRHGCPLCRADLSPTDETEE